MPRPGVVLAGAAAAGARQDGAPEGTDPPTESIPVIDPAGNGPTESIRVVDAAVDSPTDAFPAVDPALSTLDTARVTAADAATPPPGMATVPAADDTPTPPDGIPVATATTDDQPEADLIPDDPISDEPARRRTSGRRAYPRRASRGQPGRRAAAFGIAACGRGSRRGLAHHGTARPRPGSGAPGRSFVVIVGSRDTTVHGVLAAMSSTGRSRLPRSGDSASFSAALRVPASRDLILPKATRGEVVGPGSLDAVIADPGGRPDPAAGGGLRRCYTARVAGRRSMLVPTTAEATAGRRSRAGRHTSERLRSGAQQTQDLVLPRAELHHITSQPVLPGPQLRHITPQPVLPGPQLRHITPQPACPARSSATSPRSPSCRPALATPQPVLPGAQLTDGVLQPDDIHPKLADVLSELGHVPPKLGDPAFDPTQPQTVLLLGRRDPAHGGLQLADQPIQGVEIVAKLDRPVRRRLHGASVGRHPDPADAIGESATGNRPVTEISSAASARRREDR